MQDTEVQVVWPSPTGDAANVIMLGGRQSTVLQGRVTRDEAEQLIRQLKEWLES